VSPDQGRSRKAGKGGSGSARQSAPVQRLGLLLFGVGFVVLFLLVAISEGVGDPSIPSGDVILVEDAPGDSGEISQADFERALKQAASQAGVKKVPKPGDPQYNELKETAVSSLIEPAWLEGLAEEMGISVSEGEVAAELKKIKKENFPTEAEYQKFLKESGFTEQDVNRQVRVQVLSTNLQEQLKEEVAPPTQSEIEDYYEAAKATQFTQPASRSVRLIVNEDQAKAQEALAALETSNTAKDWGKLAKELSEDAATKSKGGLQEGVAEGTLEEPVDAAVFSAPEGQVEGPLKAQRGYYVFEVQNSTPESTQELKAVESQIKSTLEQRNEQEHFNAVVSNFNVTWRSRTFCADDYVTERCANFKPDGHPSTAPPACYEAEPDGGPPDACPAPVFQLIPALPGSVTPLEPQGKPLAQRPRPKEEAGGAAETPELPPGAVPPPAEAPPSE
jgi:peptidyl-prolyl cis-trans isomerase C